MLFLSRCLFKLIDLETTIALKYKSKSCASRAMSSKPAILKEVYNSNHKLTAEETHASTKGKVVDIRNCDGTLLEEAFDVLRKDGVISLPTDTIYGIAVLAQSTAGVNKIYEIKKRDLKKPIAVCISSIKDIPKFCHVTVTDDLLKDLLPGPVTLLFQRNNNLNPLLNEGNHLVGVRIPQSAFICKLAKKCGGPLALTSANLSSGASSLRIEEFKNLWNMLDLVIDGGTLGDVDPMRLGSTVIDLSIDGGFKIVRKGCAEMKTKLILSSHQLQDYTT